MTQVQVCEYIQGCFLKEDNQQKDDQVGELFKTQKWSIFLQKN